MIPYYKPHLGIDEKNAVSRVLDSGWITQGPEVEAFEKEFAERNGSKYGIAVSNATTGLFLAARYMGMFYSSFSIPRYTYAATFQAVYAAVKDWKRAIYLIDCNNSYETDTTAQKGCSVYVNLGGRPVAHPISRNWYDSIDDMAHRYPENIKEKGRIQVFSFYANKLITTGEGGMICTDDDDAYILMKNWKQHSKPLGSFDYRFREEGYNFKMTDIQASIGREQLKKMDMLKKSRQDVSQYYSLWFSKTEVEPYCAYGEDHHCHLYMIKLKSKEVREKVERKLKENGIGYSRHFQPIILSNELPTELTSVDLFERSLSLPIYPNIEEEDLNKIIKTVVEAL